MRRPFRFGLGVRAPAPARAWAEKARRVEALGFSTLLVPDHLTGVIAPMVAVTAAAAATTSLRVGPLVLNNDFRHPVLVAREAAAIDLLSGGRLELGLGAGHMQSEYVEAGIPFDPAPTRVERLAEAVAIVKGLLEGREVTFAGAHYQVRAHRIGPLPVQSPRPPVLIGGNGRRLLELAAREADIVGLTGFTHRAGGRELDLAMFGRAGAHARVALVRAAAGARFAGLELNALVQAVAGEGVEADALRSLTEGRPVDRADVAAGPFVLLGSAAGMAEALERHREELGISYFVFRESDLEAVAPIVGRLAGS